MTESSKARRWGGKAVRPVAISVFTLLMIFWIEYGFGKPLADVWRDVRYGVVIAVLVTGLCCIVMPPVAQRVWGFHPLIRWALVVSTLLTCAAAGTLLSCVIFYLFGLIPASIILLVFREDILGTGMVTLMVGVPMTIHGATSHILRATELSLRTQQLERERAEKLAAEAQLAALSSRIEPHFLFNTLNSITALIRSNPDQAELMVERLSSLLRSSLDGHDTVPVARELKLVRDYLEIQRTRLGDRLHFDICEAPEGGGMLPPFSLQTLVENSLKHVAGGRSEGVTVRVDAARSNGRLTVGVTDDGPGFDPDAMKAGHGLDNLQNRLRVLYGSESGLEFERAGGCMTVRFGVPVL